MIQPGAWRLILDPFTGDEGAAASVARGASGADAAPGAPAALPGALNMAVDQALLAGARAGAPPVLRLYRWAPACVSFGRNEPARGRYDAGAAAAAGLDLVRRPTGGLAVHHADELTYAVVGRVADLGRPRQAYLRINQALVAGLRAAGVPAELAAGAARLSVAEPGACFALPAAGEVVCGGRKLVGSAQRREGDALLQHGSILLAGDQSALTRLRVDDAERGRVDVPSSPGSTTVADVLGRALPAADLVPPLLAGFGAFLGTRLAPAPIDSGERRRVRALEARFRSDEWTWRR
jgi:lipoate-protein ligase A